jgi:ABC-2 type transport system ATP-binding protein
MGLLAPTNGTVRILGCDPIREAKRILPQIGFVAQEHPLYKSFRVEEMLTLGQKLNSTWDREMALKRLRRLNIPLRQRTGTLSGGQRAQVALIMALAKRPELLFLDEPTASLDPLARHEFQQTLSDAVKEYGISVMISSHNVADLERICDYLVILSASRVQLAEQTGHILQSHKVLVGPREYVQTDADPFSILTSQQSETRCTLLVHLHGSRLDPAWEMRDASLEEIILAYLAHPGISMNDTRETKAGVLR